MLCSTNLSRSGVNHNDDQPAHLRVKDEEAHVPAKISMQQYAAPETRFCPAKVYEYTEPTEEGEQPELVINAQNCVHCKCVLLGLRIDAYVDADFKTSLHDRCCSIKMPHEYIRWTVPEGGGGPA